MKNKYIEIERFIASCMILTLHLYISKGTWIFVEFFFLLTGYFTIAHLKKRKELMVDNIWYPILYTWNKFVKLFPYTSISLIMLWGIKLIACDLKGVEIIRWLLYLPTELLLISGSGMVPNNIQITEIFYSPFMLNAHLWYICCMLFVLPLVVYLFMYIKRAKAIVLTILPMFLYGILVMKSGTITGWHGNQYAFFFCSIRALAGLLLGGFAYFVSQWVKTPKYTSFGKYLLTTIEVLSFLIVLVASHFTELSYDALFIILLFISVSLSNSGVTYTSKLSIKFADYLGRLSLPIYCMQMPVIVVCDALGFFNPWVKFSVTIIVSIFVELMFRLAERIWSIIYPKLKSFIIL